MRLALSIGNVCKEEREERKKDEKWNVPRASSFAHDSTTERASSEIGKGASGAGQAWARMTRAAV